MGSVPGKSAGGSDAAGTGTDSAASPVAVSAPAADAAPQVAGRDAVQASAVAPAAAPDIAAASQPQQAEQRRAMPDAAAQPPVESVSGSVDPSTVSAAPAGPAAVAGTVGVAGPAQPTSQGAAAGSGPVSSPEVRGHAGLGQVHVTGSGVKCCAFGCEDVSCRLLHTCYLVQRPAVTFSALKRMTSENRAVCLPRKMQRCTMVDGNKQCCCCCSLPWCDLGPTVCAGPHVG
jgi:hypothetical protein